MLEKIYADGKNKLEKEKLKIIKVVDEVREFHTKNPPYIWIPFLNYKMQAMYRGMIGKRDKRESRMRRFPLYMRKILENDKQNKKRT